MSSRDLNDLDPQFRVLADRFLQAWREDNPSIPLVVTCTLRTLEEQAQLYAQGRTLPGDIVTRARPGESAHNYGLAMDVVPIRLGKPVWDDRDPLWQIVGAIALDSGLDWLGKPESPFIEFAHVQMPNWRSFIPAAAKRAA